MEFLKKLNNQKIEVSSSEYIVCPNYLTKLHFIALKSSHKSPSVHCKIILHRYAWTWSTVTGISRSWALSIATTWKNSRRHVIIISAPLGDFYIIHNTFSWNVAAKLLYWTRWLAIAGSAAGFGWDCTNNDSGIYGKYLTIIILSPILQFIWA